MSRSAFSSNQLNVVGPSITTSAISGGPPSNPTDGDIWIATAVDSNGTRWMFQYNAGSSSTYKWEFIGGPPAWSHYDYPGPTVLGSSTFVTAPGTAITLARGGDYWLDGVIEMDTTTASGLVEFIGLFLKSGTNFTNAGTPYMGYTEITAGTGGEAVNIKGVYPGQGATAGDTIAIQGWCNAAGTNNIRFARLGITPIRIS
jgi:hypothetical protein